MVVAFLLFLLGSYLFFPGDYLGVIEEHHIPRIIILISRKTDCISEIISILMAFTSCNFI